MYWQKRFDRENPDKAIEKEMDKRFKQRQDSNKILSFETLFLIIDEACQYLSKLR